MRIGRFALWIVVLLCVFVLLESHEVSAYAGAYCSGASPCQCGSTCNGGYELSGHSDGYCTDHPVECFNTVDSCMDGYDGYTTYEWVEDITVTDLNRSVFSAGDNVQVDALVRCTWEREAIGIIYDNGSGFKIMYNTFCAEDAFLHIYHNLTLDQVVGNHTIRAIIAYLTVDNAYCGYDTGQYGPDYSDTDDVIFPVIDSSRPAVDELSPANGSSYELRSGLVIPISARVTDNIGIYSASAYIEWSNHSRMISMTETGGSIYRGNITNITELGAYRVTIRANDSKGNTNDTESIEFAVTFETNMSIAFPSNGTVLGSYTMPLRFTLRDNESQRWVAYSVDEESDVYGDYRYWIGNNDTGDPNASTVDLNSTISLAQSFTPSRGMQMILATLYLNCSASLPRVEVRADESGVPGSIIASANVSSATATLAWVNVTFSENLLLTGNLTYWLVLNMSGPESDFCGWLSTQGLYPDGESREDSGADYLFKVFDRYSYETVLLSSEGFHSVRVSALNGLDIGQSAGPVIYGTDMDPPELRNLSVSPASSELGQNITFETEIVDSMTNVSRVLIEINGTNRSMAVHNGSWYRYIHHTTGIGNFTFRIASNDSLNNHNASANYSFAVADTVGPSIGVLNVSPADADGIDPLVPLNITVAISDLGGVLSPTIQYRVVGEAEWTNVTMSTITEGVYNGSFVPATAGNWSFQVYARDNSGNFNVSDNRTLDVYYDWSWNVTPAVLAVVSTPVYSSASLGNISIANTGDFWLTINVSQSSGIPLLTMNETVVTLGPHLAKKVSVSADAPATPNAAEYFVSIQMLALNASALPSSRIVNGSLVTYAGPYLLVDIVSYDSQVELGDHIDNVSVRIRNVGNETTTGVYLNWSIPGDWSTRSLLNKWVGSVGVGEQFSYSISVDIGQSASLGTKQISVRVNSTQGISNNDSRSVLVGNSTNATETQEPDAAAPSGGRHGGGGGAVTVSSSGAAARELRVAAPARVVVAKGTVALFTVNISNEFENATANNARISVEGFPSSRFTVNPPKIPPIRAGESLVATVTLDVPYYIPAGTRVIGIRIAADIGDAHAGLIIDKNITLVIYQTDKTTLVSCLVLAENNVTRMAADGFVTTLVNNTLQEAERAYKEQDFDTSQKLCDDVLGLARSAYSLTSRLSAARALVSESQDAEAMTRAISLVEDSLAQGDFDAASARMTQAELLLHTRSQMEQAALILPLDIARRYWLGLAFLCSLLIGGGYLVARYRRLDRIRGRMRELESQRAALRREIAETQVNHFRDLAIGSPMYDERMKRFRERMAEIEQERSAANLAIVNAYGDADRATLQSERERIVRLGQELQQSYFVERVIDHPTYNKMMRQYLRIISIIDQKMEGVKRLG